MTAVPSSYEFRDCRLLGHAWHIVPSDWTPMFGVPMTARCERCNTERRDSIGLNNGAVESRRYVLPAGYSLPKENDMPGPKRTDFRMDWLQRELQKVKNRRR